MVTILIYSDHFFPSVGGSEKYAFELAEELSRRGIRVVVVTSEKNSGKENARFEIRRLRKPVGLRRINFNFMEVLEIIRVVNPSVVHVNYQTSGESLLMLFLALKKIPYIVTFHASHSMKLGRIVNRLQSITVFQGAKKILVQTLRDKDLLISYGLSADKLTVFPFNGIRKESYYCLHRNSELGFGGASVNILFVGKLDKYHSYKGFPVILKVAAALNSMENYPKRLRFHAVGAGEFLSEYKDEVKRNNISNINFLGQLEEGDLKEMFCNSDILILPSLNDGEGFGRVALEAIASECVVIVSKYAGISELISKHNAGIVIDPKKVDTIVDIILKLLENRDLARMYIKNSKEMLEANKMTLEETVQKTIELYEIAS